MMIRVVLDFGAATTAGILTKPVATTASSFAGNPIIGPSGHRVETIHQESGFDTHLPVKGTPASHDYSKLLKMDPGARITRHSRFESSRQSYSKLLKMDFPSFDGDNPKL